MLSGTVQAAAPGLIGFDHSAAALNMATANRFAAKGYKFCVRYVSRDASLRAQHSKNGSPDLSAEEAQIILDAGMAVMAVQHPPMPGWSPTAELGTTYGANAADYAAQAGLPAGVCVWLDLEGILAGTAKIDVVSYCNAWFAEVANAGYTTGVYVGFDAILEADDLFFDLKTKHYWRAGGDVPDISHRGYQLIQNISKDAVTGAEFDRDVTKTDDLGGTVMWLVPSA